MVHVALVGVSRVAAAIALVPFVAVGLVSPAELAPRMPKEGLIRSPDAMACGGGMGLTETRTFLPEGDGVGVLPTKGAFDLASATAGTGADTTSIDMTASAPSQPHGVGLLDVR